ncbi:MAG: hypothetical protein GY710_04040 [Desulfobacteraceae bacterium]|nr:hypothetical protein [Desulfobacteraceae bacterium]
MTKGGMTKFSADCFDVLSMPPGYQQIPPEKIKNQWAGKFRVKAKDTVDEFWHFDEVFKADDRNKAILKALKAWDFLFDYSYFESKDMVTCRKEIEPVFMGWGEKE